MSTAQDQFNEIFYAEPEPECEQFDADGLGCFRGFLHALIMTAGCVAVVWAIIELCRHIGGN